MEGAKGRRDTETKGRGVERPRVQGRTSAGRRRDLRPSGLRQSGTKRQSHGAPPTSLRGLTPPSLLHCEIPACHTPHVGRAIRRAASINRLPVRTRRANRHGEGQRPSVQSPRHKVRGSTSSRPLQPAPSTLQLSTFDFQPSVLPPTAAALQRTHLCRP